MKRKYVIPQITIVKTEVETLLAASTMGDTEWNPGIGGDNNGIIEEDLDNPLIDGDLG